MSATLTPATMTTATEQLFNLRETARREKLRKKIQKKNWAAITDAEIALLARATSQTKTPPKTANERLKAHRARLATVTHRQCQDPARRARLEAKPEQWLKFYLENSYPLPWGKVHRAMIRAAKKAIVSGTSMVCAAPRGTGKSTLLWGVILWAVLSGKAAYPVICAYTHSASKRMLRAWLEELSTNPRLRADYPELTQPYEVSCHANRLRSLIWDDGTPCNADVRVGDGVIVLPNGSALGSISLNGNTRGLIANTSRGTIRPDVLLIDDPQDSKTANSSELSRKTVERIDSDLLSLGGPSQKLALMMACTVIAVDDVAEHYLSNPEYTAIRVPQITSWPDGWENSQSESRKGWQEWQEIRLQGLANGDGGKAARAYYRAHKKVLTAGMAVSWTHRKDKKRNDPDALYAAMWDYYRLGHIAFLAERQNSPEKETTVYSLTPDTIKKHIDANRARYEVPKWAVMIVAGSDINHYGIHSVVLAIGRDQTAAIVDYRRFDNNGAGVVPKNAPEAVRKKLIYEALASHGIELAGLALHRDGKPVSIGYWLIDGGYEHSTVQQYVQGHGRTVGIPCNVIRGYSADKYRPTPRNCIGKPREGCHLTESGLGQWLAGNVDYWREISQRAWLGPIGAPGTVSLPAGTHSEIAEHICREKLVDKIQTRDGSTVWRWKTQPGWHDYGDALTYAYIAGAWGGIGTSAPTPQRAKTTKQKSKPRRQAKVQIGG